MNSPATNNMIAAPTDLVSVLTAIAGKSAVYTKPEALTFFSTDIAGAGVTAEAVVRIDDVPTLSKVVAACAELGRGVIPRGGGFSYTGGYTPSEPGCVILDLRGLDKIVEINTEDMYVIVEAGCSWMRLYEALKVQGVRTPYFGPMSGFHATVGGALSQGSFFLGSSQHGAAADSVLGLEVVLADGTLLRTGSGASAETPPFFRQYGPDATGLFLSDAGAMGIKARAILRLIPFPARQAFASFAFSSHRQALAAVSHIGRSGLAAECYCWDPYFVKLMTASASTQDYLRFAMNIVKAAPNAIEGVVAVVRMAVSGRRAFNGETWLMHVVADDSTAAGAAGRLRLIRDAARQSGGREVAPSAPLALRGTPFTDFNTPERRSNRRSLPTNSLSPHSRAGAVTDEVYALLDRRAAQMDARGVHCGVILFALGGQAVGVEPLIYWEDEVHALNDRIAETSDLEALAAHPETPLATQLAFSLRDEMKAIFRRHGCIHMQIGRSYPWLETRDLAARSPAWGREGHGRSPATLSTAAPWVSAHRETA